MQGSVLTVSVTEFKAKCLALFDDLEGRKVSKIVVTRHGRPVAELNAPSSELAPIHGAHRGSVRFLDGEDGSEPASGDDNWDAAHGILHR